MEVNLLDRLDKDSAVLLQRVGRLAKGMGMNAYLVGGPVRDLWLGQPNADLDLMVEGNGIRLAEAFAAAEQGTVKSYPAFGTATVSLPQGRCVDFATARKESYVRPGAFPAVVPAGVREDLFRRDFTINALAVALNPGQWGTIHDEFGGLQDLKAGKIRILHPRSFIDDPTRILRAARFKARLKFSIERDTLKRLKAALREGALKTIKTQRYMKEYNKTLKEPGCQEAIKVLKSWGALTGRPPVNKGDEQHVTHRPHQ